MRRVMGLDDYPSPASSPSPRYNHAACYDEENNRLVVFGGRTAERKRLNDVAFLDLDSWSWYKPSMEGAAPSPREQAVATFWAGSMVLFGEDRARRRGLLMAGIPSKLTGRGILRAGENHGHQPKTRLAGWGCGVVSTVVVVMLILVVVWWWSNEVRKTGGG